MKCQILFSGKNKKNIISLSSAENAQRVVKVKDQHMAFSSLSGPWLVFYCNFINVTIETKKK